jgi:hypothetical protein
MNIGDDSRREPVKFGRADIDKLRNGSQKSCIEAVASSLLSDASMGDFPFRRIKLFVTFVKIGNNIQHLTAPRL